LAKAKPRRMIAKRMRMATLKKRIMQASCARLA
jgi:hypothetical protein